ncbi:hypothetical protein [Hyphomicrobium sp. DY-1]|uniref:hypothetical protein n=1 Tax=Hyphomicrobium sp. DY-1 TaxID=3075650 RepID=UPI0039C47C94
MMKLRTLTFLLALSLLSPVPGYADEQKNNDANAVPQSSATPGSGQNDARALFKDAEDAYYTMQDFTTAFQKYKAAAELGNASAANMVGRMYAAAGGALPEWRRRQQGCQPGGRPELQSIDQWCATGARYSA